MGRGLGDWDVGRVFGTWVAWAGTWGRGDVVTWGRGDVGTWGRGDVGRGDVGTWGCANKVFRNENLTRVARVDLYGLVTRVVHIMLTIFTIMLILYAQKMLLLCSKSPTIMLKIFPPNHPFFTAILETGI